MGSRVAEMADVAVEISLEEQISALETENRVLKDRVKTAARVNEQFLNSDTARFLALEGIILRQREQLRTQSEALYRRKKATRTAMARYQEVLDNVSAAQRWVEEKRRVNREEAEWRAAKGK